MVNAMVMNAFVASVFSIVVVGTFAADRNIWFEQRTKFIIYDSNNTAVFESTNRDDNLEDALESCWPSKEYALIVHGFTESCTTPWAVQLRQNLIQHRGGCIICMDYKQYADNYLLLLAYFKEIAQVLTDKLNVLRSMSFQSDDAYLFGFSYGSRLVVEAANNFGQKQFGNIHLCEPAGPGFDGTNTSDPKTAAINSQCIHTNSGGLGTTERKCHQNWNMGDCGKSQVGQRPFPLGNHGLCPEFYNYAFTNVFAAVEKSNTCHEPINDRDLKQLPTDQTVRMGYYEDVQDEESLNGVNLYAVTSRDPPFN